MASCGPRNYLRPCLLLLLGERADYGYELTERLQELGAIETDSTGVYRTLRSLEDEGVVRSSWTPSRQGPPRKIYELTAEGRTVLRQWAVDLDGVRALLDVYLDRYEDFAAKVHTAQVPDRPAASSASRR